MIIAALMFPCNVKKHFSFESSLHLPQFGSFIYSLMFFNFILKKIWILGLKFIKWLYADKKICLSFFCLQEE